MKSSSLLLTSVFAIALPACSATTGAVTKNMAKQAAISSVTSSVEKPGAVNTPVAEAPAVDANLDCAALETELAEVNGIIAASNKTIAGSTGTEVAGKVAATGASQAALHSGAAGALAKVPFGGMFAKKAVNSVANVGQKKIESAKIDLQNANLRKATLNGMYAGKNCSS